MVGWDIDSLDWQNHNPEMMTSIIKKGASVGYEVVLMHDIHKETVEGVKKVLKELDAQGFQFVTIDTLMKQDRNCLLYTSDWIVISIRKSYIFSHARLFRKEKC